MFFQRIPDAKGDSMRHIDSHNQIPHMGIAHREPLVETRKTQLVTTQRVMYHVVTPPVPPPAGEKEADCRR